MMRILTVDDSAVARRSIRRELDAAGYEVLEAASGDEALRRFVVDRPHLVTLDVHMEGIDGFETCMRIRALELMSDPDAGAQVPVVFVTAEDTLAGRQRGFEAGAVDFVAKPFAPGSVRRTVDGILRPTPLGDRLTALVVDDSPLLRRIVCDALAPLGLAVMRADDGQEALRILRRDPDAVDIVVTDCIMARMNGDTLCRHIRADASLAHLPVIVLSALDEAHYLADIMRAGATDFIPKPFVKEVFQSRVGNHLRRLLAGAGTRERMAGLEQEPQHAEALRRFGLPTDALFAELMARANATEAGLRGLSPGGARK